MSRRTSRRASRHGRRNIGPKVWEAGRQEGRVVGQRESLRRHAAMKFDSETAARLGAVLEGVTDQEAFDGVLARCSNAIRRPSCSRGRPRWRRTNGRNANAPADC